MIKTKNVNYKHYLMLLPFFIPFIIFIFYPMVSGLIISFLKWNGNSPAKFVGFNNYLRVFRSRNFTKSFTNLFTYVIITVPINIFISLVLAIFVNGFKGIMHNTLRATIFLPTLIPKFLAGSIWRWLLAPDVGLINAILGKIGIEQILWLTNPKYMIASLIIVDVWISAGFNMLIISTGLKNIPKELYEAAKVDGATSLQQSMYITVPQLEPILFLTTTYGFISALQIFDLPWIMTASTYVDYGGNQKGLLFPSMEMMSLGFNGLKFGEASAYGFILTITILLVTVVQFIGRKKRNI